MRRTIWIPLLLMAALAGPAAAQEYSFSVPEMTFAVTVKPDASVELFYDITFTCSPGAHPIDIVDMGLPHRGYDISNMEAVLTKPTGEKYEITEIFKSEVVSIGVEVHLGAGTIQPGETGNLLFRCTMPDLVYQDTTRKDYASLRITPTWWDGQYLRDTTKLGILVYLPKDIKPEELLYQDENAAYSSKGSTDTSTFAGWYETATRMDGAHTVGLSFPKRNMNRVVKMTIFGLLMKWWEESPGARTWAAVILFILFGIMFFRASRGTGISCFIVLLVVLGFLWINSPTLELLAIPALPVIWYFSEKSLKKRRGKYLPAIKSVEGGGVKRGLTAPEAAVLLELPLNRVLALVLFGLMKKGIADQVSDNPLKMRVRDDYNDEKRKDRRRAASDNGTVIHGYEQDFIEALVDAGAIPVPDINFAKPMKNLIESVAKRVTGFDLERSKSYYNYIVNRAWHDAKEIGDVEKRTQYTDDNLLWLMTSPNYHDNFNYWHSHGYHYHAPWSRSGPVGGGVSVPDTPVGGRTSFSDVAASFSGWSENVAGGLAAKMDPVSIGVSKEGIFNLAGADKVTLDVLEGMASGSGGGGGGGGCACAGCACACACAGGGR